MQYSEIRNAAAFSVGAVVFYADVIAGFALGLLYSLFSAKVLGMPWGLVAASAAMIGVGVSCVVRALPRNQPLKRRLEGWALRVDALIAQPIATGRVMPDRVPRSEPVAQLATAETARRSSVTARSTSPRALEPWELPAWKCWRCGGPAVKGTHAWDDRGPGQLLSNHVLTCQAGHGWTNSTDGG